MLSDCKILTTRNPRVPSNNHTYVHICGMRHSQFSKSHDCLAGRWNEPTVLSILLDVVFSASIS